MNLGNREHRLVDVSKVKDARYKGAGIHVGDDNWARCTAELSETIRTMSTAREGTTPYPYGIYLFRGEANQIPNPPPVLLQGPFLELLPCDREDRRAVKLTWNASGTEASFSFAALAAALGIDAPKGATLWIDAISVQDTDSKPVVALPLGDQIQVQPVKSSAAARQE